MMREVAHLTRLGTPLSRGNLGNPGNLAAALACRPRGLQIVTSREAMAEAV